MKTVRLFYFMLYTSIFTYTSISDRTSQYKMESPRSSATSACVCLGVCVCVWFIKSCPESFVSVFFLCQRRWIFFIINKNRGWLAKKKKKLLMKEYISSAGSPTKEFSLRFCIFLVWLIDFMFELRVCCFLY